MNSVRKGLKLDAQIRWSELVVIWGQDKTIFETLRGRRISPWYLDSGVSQVSATEAPSRLRQIMIDGDIFRVFAEYSGRDHFGNGLYVEYLIDSAKGLTVIDVSLEQLSSLRALLDKEREEENEELLVPVS